MVSDFELIQACLAGDKDIFSELVARYKNLVYSIILRMINNSDEAADLAQEIFIKVYINLAKYHPEYKFSTWIIRITTNHVIDYRRKKKPDSIPIEEMEYEKGTRITDSPESEYIKKERGEKLAAIVAELPDIYKVPIVLYHRQGLSYQEIADITKEPLSKVKNRIFRGRKMLKDIIAGLKERENYDF